MKQHDTGTFITFEGINGAGKTTIQRLVAGYLKLCYTRPVHVTKQPGGSSIGKVVRELAFDQKLHRDAASMLIQADRCAHVHECLIPWLDNGDFVLCDRYIDSTTAYQVYGQGWDPEFTRMLNELATGGLLPDLTVLLDIQPRTSLLRDKQSSRYWKDEEQITKLEAIQAGYLHLASLDPRWVVLDVEQANQDEVFEAVISKLVAHFDLEYSEHAMQWMLEMATTIKLNAMTDEGYDTFINDVVNRWNSSNIK